MSGKSFSDYKGGLSAGAGFFRNSSEDFPLMQSCDIQAGEGDKRLNVVLDELYRLIAAAGGNTASSAKPIEVSTEEKMNSILASATASSLGTVYKYVGTTTDLYENGALYIIAEAILDGNGVVY